MVWLCSFMAPALGVDTQQTSWMSLTARAIVAFIIVINLNHLDLNVIATENCIRQHGCACNATGWSRVL